MYPKDAKILRSIFAMSIKDIETDKPVFKSLLVAQGHLYKENIKMSKLPPSKLSNPSPLLKSSQVWNNDITQSYIQSTEKLIRKLYLHLVPELRLPSENPTLTHFSNLWSSWFWSLLESLYDQTSRERNGNESHLWRSFFLLLLRQLRKYHRSNWCLRGPLFLPRNQKESPQVQIPISYIQKLPVRCNICWPRNRWYSSTSKSLPDTTRTTLPTVHLFQILITPRKTQLVHTHSTRRILCFSISR